MENRRSTNEQNQGKEGSNERENEKEKKAKE